MARWGSGSMSISELSDFWDAAASIGADEFIVRRTIGQLSAHELSLREAIAILQSYMANQANSANAYPNAPKGHFSKH